MRFDAARKTALQAWSSQLSDLEKAVIALKATSELLAAFQDDSNSSKSTASDEGISFDDVCKTLDLSFTRFETLQGVVRNIVIGIRRVRNCSFTLSPISRLPPELLRHVFILIARSEKLASTPNHRIWPSYDGYTDPIEMIRILSHVSHLWRAISLETSAMWTRIEFGDSPRFDQSALWMDRAKGAGLSVRFCPEYIKDSHTAFALALPSALQWTQLTMRGTWDVVGNLTQSMRTLRRFPRNLERLCIEIDAPEYSAADADFTEVSGMTEFLAKFQGRLKEVEIYFTSLIWSVHIQPLVSPSLVVLKLGTIRPTYTPSWQQVDQVIRTCNNLEVLEIHCIEAAVSEGDDGFADDSGDETSDEPCTLAKLSYLSLYNITTNVAHRLYTVLRAPALQSICIPLQHFEFSSSIIRFIQQSPCSQLRALEIRGSPYNQQNWEPLSSRVPSVLQHLSQLKQLRVDGGSLVFILQGLTPNEEFGLGGYQLPLLEELQVRNIALVIPQVMKIVTSRKESEMLGLRNLRPLKFLSISPYSNIYGIQQDIGRTKARLLKNVERVNWDISGGGVTIHRP
jgi:hypothetical protein